MKARNPNHQLFRPQDGSIFRYNLNKNSGSGSWGNKTGIPTYETELPTINPSMDKSPLDLELFRSRHAAFSAKRPASSSYR